MRDPARIDRILEAVREVWTGHPDLRLGQILVNAIHPSRPCPQIFYAEDDVAERGLTSATQPAYQQGEVTLELSLNEAVTLIAFLLRFRDESQLTIEDEAETQILYDLCALLEQQLGGELTEPGWRLLVENARRAVRQ